MRKATFLIFVALLLFLSMAFADHKTITLISAADLDSLNFKLNEAMGAFILWMLLQAWDAFKKSKDTVVEDIKAIKTALVRLETDLATRPTWEKLRLHITDDTDRD